MDPSASKAKASANSGCSSNEMEIITYMSLDLYIAAEDGMVDPFKNYDGHLDLLLTPIKDTILHLNLATPSKRSTDFVKELLNICPSFLLQINANGDTPLHVAARYGHFDIVKLLVERAKAQDNDLEINGVGSARQMLRIMNKKKETALHEAARNNHPNVVELLTEEDPHFLYSANDCGETPLYLAAERGHLQVVIKILNTCTSVAYSGPNGKTALHAAVMHRHRARYGHSDAAKVLINQAKASPDKDLVNGEEEAAGYEAANVTKDGK